MEAQKNYLISRPIRRTVIFSLGILEKNNDICTLLLVIYCSVSQTVVLRFCPCGPFRLNISPKKTEKIKLT